jgi:hypothetical protein
MADEPTDKERDKKRKEMDVNEDGVISEAERKAYKAQQELEPDPLSRKELAVKYGYALNVLMSNPELERLFTRAVNAKKGQWAPERFIAELKNTDWYKQGKFYRDAWVMEQEGSEWQDQMQAAREVISRRATALGAGLDEGQVDKLARRYLYEGWYSGPRSAFLDNALSEMIVGDTVGEEDVEGSLRNLAWDYGVEQGLDENWYLRAQKDLAQGKTTMANLTNQLKQMSMSKFAPVSESINNGQTARQALKQYSSTMADLLELDETKIDLNDPLLKKAWTTQMGKDGQSELMTVFDFEEMVRKDPRWQATGNGRRATMDAATSFLKSLGFNGRG